MARKLAPETVEEKDFNRSEFNVNKDDSKRKSKRCYVFSAAVGGQSLNRALFKTVQYYCKVNNAQLGILVMRGVSKKDEMYPQELQEHADHFVSQYVLNNNLKAMDLMLYPQQQQPLLGLDRIGQKDRSLIIAHPKQHMRSTPVSNRGLPHLLFSTGAITNPDNYAHTRAGMLAEQDHVCGGLIVEVEDDEVFHVRQFQADSKGGFCDLDSYYCGDKKSKATVEAFILGDYHVGSEDPTAVSAWQQVTKLVNPKRIFFHDFCDGLAVNHHLDNNIVARLKRPEKFQNIESELEEVKSALISWRVRFKTPEFYMVASNHDDFVNRYVSALKHFHNDKNFLVSNKMIEVMVKEDANPIEWFLKQQGFVDPKTKWLRRDEDFKICGVQLASHGDKGPNGSKGSAQSLRNIGPAVCGHFHSPFILSPLWIVGTTTRLNLDYTIGSASSWMHSSCLLYSNGQRTMINSISGAWKI
jgi:hypothetical protein